MQWEKMGCIFTPNISYPWSRSHAQVPTVDVLSEKVWRVYYCARDADNHSRISYFEVEAANPSNILYIHDRPILQLGKLGAFDDAGMMPSSVVNVNGIKYLYYTGWSVRTSVPYQNAIGLAISNDGGRSFVRAGEGPVLGASLNDPYFIGTATIFYENGLWRNWYATCTEWKMVGKKAEPRYHLKYAESLDGIEWQRSGVVAIDYIDNNEGGLVRAKVIKWQNKYLMWYSRRGIDNYRNDRRHSYRIGYAESSDGIRWVRMDDRCGIDASQNGWDSEMIAYPDVVQKDGAYFLFYNGNGFGRSGIGAAVCYEA